MIFVTACSEDAIVTEQQHNVTITAISEDWPSESRTCVDLESLGSGALALMWSPGDSIGVFDELGDTKNALFTATTTANASESDFVGSMSSAPAYAYYPYSSANAGRSVANLVGTVPAVQPFSTTTGRLTGDYKVGTPVSSSGSGKYKFVFEHLFTLLVVEINASETNLAGEKLDYIEVTATDADGSARSIAGDFAFSAVDGSWGSVTNPTATIRMPWADHPTLANNQTFTGFVNLMPDVKEGDQIAITVVTENHKATFTATSKITFQRGAAYKLPLTLKNIQDKASDYGWKVKELPVLNSLKFTVANNTGKLLDNKLVWNSKNNPEFQSVSEHVAEINGNEASLVIPYLYDFKLVPTFTASAGATVIADGVAITSGKSVVDFTKPVTFTVDVDGDTRDYTVSVTNTGLPVVVIDQSTSGDLSKKTEGGFMGIGATVVNEFVNFYVRDKDAAWVTDDVIKVYNADGSIDVDATGGVRLRGNTSKLYPKKPFAIKLNDKAKVLGMPKHKRWVLLANWLDHSMIRNSVALDIAHTIENTWRATDGMAAGIPWNVHGQNVELVFEGHHVGNYYLCEQIKIGGSRLDIQDAYEDVKNPTFATCGYLLEWDNNYDETLKFKTTKLSLPINFKDDKLSDEIFNAVKSKINGIEANLANKNFADAFADLDIYTVIDQWLIWELTMNREFIEPRSVYYYMDGDTKLCAGPVWDFDRGTFQNTTNAKSQGSDRVKPYNEWVYWIGTSGTSNPHSLWLQYMFQSEDFCQAVKDRWAQLYPALQGVVGTIEAYRSSQKLSWQYDSAMWPTNKSAIQAHKSGFSDWSGDENLSTFDEIIDNMITVYNARLDGMNTLINSGNFIK